MMLKQFRSDMVLNEILENIQDSPGGSAILAVSLVLRLFSPGVLSTLLLFAFAQSGFDLQRGEHSFLVFLSLTANGGKDRSRGHFFNIVLIG